MIKVTISNNSKEVLNEESDFAITFLMKSLPAEDSTKIKAAIEGDLNPIYFYYLGNRLAHAIKDLTSDEDSLDEQFLLTLLKKGIDDEINNQEV